MSDWFLIVLVLILLSSIVVILMGIERKKEIKRLEDGNLSADDFDIIG